MAYIVSVTESSIASAASTGSIAFPSHNTDDLLLVCLTNDGGGTNFAVTGGTGWALIGTGAASGSQRQQWAYKVATGSGDDPTFSGATNEWIVAAIVIRDAHATAPFGSLVSGTDFVRDDYTAVGSKDSGALTAAVDDCLLLYSWSLKQSAATDLITVAPDSMTVDSLYSYSASAQVAHIIGHRQTGTAAAAPTIKVYTTNAAQGGSGWVLAVRNKASGVIQPDARVGAEVVKWYGDFGTAFETLTYSSLSTLTTDTIAGLAISTATPGGGTLTVSHATADTPNPPGRYTNIATTENSAGIWVGTSHAVTANMAGKVLSVQWQVAAALSTQQLGSNGWIVLLSDGATWIAYQLSPLLSTLAVDTAYTHQIAVGASTAFATHASGAPDFTAITSIGFAWHRAGSNATSRSMNIRRLMLLDTAKVVGGASSLPTKFSQLADNATASRVRKLCDKQGKGQVLAKGKVQIGDGVVPTYFKLAAQSLEYPLTFSASDILKNVWNADASSVGVTIYAKAGDTVDFGAGVVATETAQPFVIHASSSLSATYSFAGTSFVGWTITDNAGLSWTSATIQGGGIFTLAGGGDLTNCSITETTSTNAALSVTANGTVITETTISGTGAAYALELGTSVTAITLASCTLTTGSTDKVHVLKTTGTVTITISGTTTLVAGDVTTEGATVVIAAPEPTLDATVLASSRVVLYNNTTAAELDNTAPAGTSWSKVITSGASNGDSLTLHVFKEGYQEFSTTFLYAAADATILVTQEADPNLTSLRSELSITDYTTITEFALDVTGTVEIDADDADGSSQKARLAIWYNGVLTTENGARYLRGAITILSTAAFRINTSVLDLKIENVSATYGLNFTDTERRLYRDDGAAIYAPASAPGSIQNDYSGVPDTVETGVSGLTGSESAQLMGLPNATTIAAAVWAYVVTGSTTAVQMMRGFAAVLLGKVSGAGTGTETFRDIADTTDVVVATVDSDGNRTAITRTLT